MAILAIIANLAITIPIARYWCLSILSVKLSTINIAGRNSLLVILEVAGWVSKMIFGECWILFLCEKKRCSDLVLGYCVVYFNLSPGKYTTSVNI